MTVVTSAKTAAAHSTASSSVRGGGQAQAGGASDFAGLLGLLSQEPDTEALALGSETLDGQDGGLGEPLAEVPSQAPTVALTAAPTPDVPVADGSSSPLSVWQMVLMAGAPLAAPAAAAGGARGGPEGAAARGGELTAVGSVRGDAMGGARADVDATTLAAVANPGLPVGTPGATAVSAPAGEARPFERDGRTLLTGGRLPAESPAEGVSAVPAKSALAAAIKKLAQADAPVGVPAVPESAGAARGVGSEVRLRQELSSHEVTVAMAPVGGEVSSVGIRPQSRRDEGKADASVSGVSAASPSLASVDPGWGPIGGATASDPGQTLSGQRNPEDVVAEQVTYWVHQKRQGAELTLDGGAGQHLAVSISMSGNEAHIVFRAEQAQTRDLLNGALPELQALLNTEGLVLSGVSVQGGGVGEGRSSGQPSQPGTTPARNARGATPEVGAVAVGRRAVTTERTLDLYV